jgi:hypothetical protein
MSYLALPRIGFRGSNAYVNPSTANNQNVADFLDYSTVKLKNPPISDVLPEMDPSEYRAWMMSLMTLQSQGSNQQQMPGYWNYYGDHLTHFGEATVNSLWLQGMAPVTSGSDPLLGALVMINGQLIDVDPADTFCSWIISGIFNVMGKDENGQMIDLIKGTNPTIACSRWLNFGRPMGAGTFQCVIPRERLSFNPNVQSEALDALHNGVDKNAGIIVRYCLYAMQTNPLNTSEYLFEQFQQGNYLMNPKIGRVLGSIGVWNGTDMCSAPVGRLLYPPDSPYNTRTFAASPVPRFAVKTHNDLDRLWDNPEKEILGPANMAVEKPGTPGMPFIPGPAAAVVDHERQVIMLDLLTTIPEKSRSDMTKVDIGPVSLGLRYTDLSGQKQSKVSVVFSPIPYDQKTYEDQAGVVEVSYAGHPELAPYIDKGTLFLYQQKTLVLLEEIGTAQVETDDRCVYFQQNEAATIDLRVFVKGEPAKEEVTVQLEQWRDFNVAGEVVSRDPLVVTPPAFCFEQVPASEMDIPTSIRVPSGGKAQLTIQPRTPGCYKLRFIPPGATKQNIPSPPCPQNVPDFTIEFFCNYRVLPADDYSHYTDEQINNWSFIFEHVFSYYALLYPIMSTIIPWGPKNAPKEEEKVREFAALMKHAIDEKRLGSPLAMPITRELSAGKRKLLQRWCDLQLQP